MSSSENPTPLKENSPEKPGISFSLSDLWQHIPRPQSSPEHEHDVLVEKSANIILGDVVVDETEFNEKVKSLIWLTYRTGFEAIPKNPNGPHPLSFIHSMVFNKNPFSSNIHSFVDNDNFTTDVGWGCMIRTSQSLLANALNRIAPDKESFILDLFKDTYDAPFSLHNFIRVANELPLQVVPGQWFGPNAASLSIQRLCRSISDDKFPKFLVIVSETSDVYDDKIAEAFDKKESVLLLLPIRLGVDKTNEFYYSSIFQLLDTSNSVGIAGGRPSSSFYFFGYNQDDLLYLDPHYPQTVEQGSATYHTDNFQRLNIRLLDPSMMMGLVFKNPEDYANFKKSCIDNGNKIVHFAPSSTIQESVNIKRTESRANTDGFTDVMDDFDDLAIDEESIVENDGVSPVTETVSVPEDSTTQSNEYEKVVLQDQDTGKNVAQTLSD